MRTSLAPPTEVTPRVLLVGLSSQLEMRSPFSFAHRYVGLASAVSHQELEPIYLLCRVEPSFHSIPVDLTLFLRASTSLRGG